MGKLRAMKECPACGELYPAGQDCECGYCDHAHAAIGETCPICGGCVQPAMPDAVAELLDAADELLTKLAIYPELAADLAVYPGLLFSITSAIPVIAGSVSRLRQAVTEMQGTAGLSVTAGGGA